MSNYPDDFNGTPYDKEREPTDAEIMLEAHKAALRNVVGFAFKQWPLPGQYFHRKTLIDAAANSAMVDLERLLSLSGAQKETAMDERLNYLDANKENEPDSVVQCLESMLYVYEREIEGGL